MLSQSQGLPQAHVSPYPHPAHLCCVRPLLSPTETYRVIVKCTNTTHGLLSPFSLNLTATVRTNGRCSKADTATSAISGYGVPDLMITPLTNAPYCGLSTTSLAVSFNVSSPDVPPGTDWSYSTDVTGVNATVAPTCNNCTPTAIVNNTGECLARRCRQEARCRKCVDGQEQRLHCCP